MASVWVLGCSFKQCYVYLAALWNIPQVWIYPNNGWSRDHWAPFLICVHQMVLKINISVPNKHVLFFIVFILHWCVFALAWKSCFSPQKHKGQWRDVDLPTGTKTGQPSYLQKLPRKRKESKKKCKSHSLLFRKKKMHWDKSSYLFSGQPTRQEKVMYLDTVWAAITNGCVTMVAEDRVVWR